MTNYNYKGYRPYGAGECFIIDGFASDEFEVNGNATEMCIENGAEFTIIDDNNAKLKLSDNLIIDFVK